MFWQMLSDSFQTFCSSLCLEVEGGQSSTGIIILAPAGRKKGEARQFPSCLMPLVASLGMVVSEAPSGLQLLLDMSSVCSFLIGDSSS